MPNSTLDVAEFEGVTVIAFGLEFQNLNNSYEDTLDELGDMLVEVAHNSPKPLIVIDLPLTLMFGSVFLGVLFRVWLRLKFRQGGRLGLSSVSPMCREVLEVTHLDRIWEVFETPDEAVRAFAS